MTGEMLSITQDGIDNDGNCWATQAAIAKALDGELRPFDQYQGPYVVIGPDVRLGQAPYAVAPVGLGIVRLWIVPCSDSYDCQVYREDTDQLSRPFNYDDEAQAIEAAQALLV